MQTLTITYQHAGFTIELSRDGQAVETQAVATLPDALEVAYAVNKVAPIARVVIERSALLAAGRLF